MSAILARRFLLVALLGIASVTHAGPEFTVTPTTIPQVAVIGGGFAIQPNLTIQVTVSNIGDQAATSIVGQVSSINPTVIVVESEIFVGNLGIASATTPKDTVSFYIPDGLPFDAADLVWDFTWDQAFEDQPPVADAGNSRTAFVAETVMLDGSGSSDADGEPLTYQWSIISAPARAAPPRWMIPRQLLRASQLMV